MFRVRFGPPGTARQDDPRWLCRATGVVCCACLVAGLVVIVATSVLSRAAGLDGDFMRNYQVSRNQNGGDGSITSGGRASGGVAAPPSPADGAATDIGGGADAPISRLRRWNTSRALAHCATDFSALRPQQLPRHPQGRCFVSDKYRLVYVLVPKAGSSTSRAICLRYGMQKTTVDRLTAEQRGYFTFGFWRDPQARLPSAFGTLLARAAGGSSGGGSRCLEFVKSAGATAAARERLCRDMYTEEKGFHLFVDDLVEFAGVGFDEHIRPQTSFFALTGTGEPMRLDYLANVEHLSDSWLTIAEMRGFEPPLTDVAAFVRNTREGEQWLTKLRTNRSRTAGTTAAVRQLYRQDYCCFDSAQADSACPLSPAAATVGGGSIRGAAPRGI